MESTIDELGLDDVGREWVLKLKDRLEELRAILADVAFRAESAGFH